MGIYHAVHDHCRHHAQPQVHPEGHTTGAEEAPPAEEISPTEKTSPAEKTSSTKIKSSVEKTFSVKQTSPVRETPHIGETLPTEETSQADKSSWAERYFWLPSVTAIVQRLLRVWDEPIKRSMLVVALAVLSHVFLDTLGEDPHGVLCPIVAQSNQAKFICLNSFCTSVVLFVPTQGLHFAFPCSPISHADSYLPPSQPYDHLSRASCACPNLDFFH